MVIWSLKIGPQIWVIIWVSSILILRILQNRDLKRLLLGLTPIPSDRFILWLFIITIVGHCILLKSKWSPSYRRKWHSWLNIEFPLTLLLLSASLKWGLCIIFHDLVCLEEQTLVHFSCQGIFPIFFYCFFCLIYNRALHLMKHHCILLTVGIVIMRRGVLSGSLLNRLNPLIARVGKGFIDIPRSWVLHDILLSSATFSGQISH